MTDVGGDLSVLGPSDQLDDVFKTAILTTKTTLEQMQDGQVLTAMNGEPVTVTVKM